VRQEDGHPAYLLSTRCSIANVKVPRYYTGKLGICSLLCVIVVIPLAVEDKGAAALVVGVFGVIGCAWAWQKYGREGGH
jgi:hypothetical protein